ncbi:hypothetical protein CFT12S00416_07785 [Campylobacter fetus subsp. testudinum]|uniref:hypothetical protein n=1 Tax=Campylobacter fetus TaxID=196 RepID=UPI0008187F4E|nr:hypothetical protein [Campylobacter fetus]OCR87719.1 hypothetical protein CFT12S00416_07785 [Campylobacter fetus subsp. testudinum]OCR98876.1 hypothetical protein A9K75_09510 [Campylobacter fetus subsp. testudinum]
MATNYEEFAKEIQKIELSDDFKKKECKAIFKVSSDEEAISCLISGSEYTAMGYLSLWTIADLLKAQDLNEEEKEILADKARAIIDFSNKKEYKNKGIKTMNFYDYCLLKSEKIVKSEEAQQAIEKAKENSIFLLRDRMGVDEEIIKSNEKNIDIIANAIGAIKNCNKNCNKESRGVSFYMYLRNLPEIVDPATLGFNPLADNNEIYRMLLLENVKYAGIEVQGLDSLIQNVIDNYEESLRVWKKFESTKEVEKPNIKEININLPIVYIIDDRTNAKSKELSFVLNIKGSMLKILGDTERFNDDTHIIPIPCPMIDGRRIIEKPNENVYYFTQQRDHLNESYKKLDNDDLLGIYKVTSLNKVPSLLIDDCLRYEKLVKGQLFDFSALDDIKAEMKQENTNLRR